MRRDRILTNETCNHNCTFCDARRAAEQPETVATSAVRARIVAAIAGGASEIVLSGGEPTMRRDLAQLVMFAHSAGAEGVYLETNGALVGRECAEALASARLSGARVHLPAWGERADVITRDQGGFARTLQGMFALASAGIPLSVAIPIVRSNLEFVAEVPAALAASRLPVEEVVLVIPSLAPDPSSLADVQGALVAVARVADECRRVGIAARLDPATYFPPCAFERPDRVAHLYSLSRGGASREGFVRVAECRDCTARESCPGVPVRLRESAPDLAFRPITEDRVRRRLTVISSLREQIARELVARETTRHADGTVVDTSTVRINFHCNQACRFCFVSTHLPPPDDQDVRAEIVAAGRAGRSLALSGGEPTLNPRLAEYARFAKREGVPAIELQTNAVRLADRALVAELAAAGIDDALVSLHGSTAQISDSITGAPGTFEKTLRGLDALAASSIRVRVNFVFCEANRAEFPRVVELVARRWPKASITISFVGSHTDVVPRTSEMIPRYTDVIPSIIEGIAIADAAGLAVTGWTSMCGLPLCLVPEDKRRFAELPLLADGDDGGGEFMKPDACTRCALEKRCWGVRRGYVELHGDGELLPVGPAPR